MEENTFRIGKMARMAGLAPETIRHYEKKGIIAPSKSPDGIYRQYDIFDVCTLGKIRDYLQYGFTLEEVRRMLYEMDPQELAEAVGRREQEMEDDLMRRLALLQGIRRKRREFPTPGAAWGAMR